MLPPHFILFNFKSLDNFNKWVLKQQMVLLKISLEINVRLEAFLLCFGDFNCISRSPLQLHLFTNIYLSHLCSWETIIL